MEAMQVIKKNSKPIAIAAGVAGAAAVTIAGLYLLYKRISNRTPKTTTSNPSNIEDLTERELESIIKGIKVTYDGQTLSLDTVVETTVAITKFITVTSQKLQDENSKLRSANKNNLKLYAQLCKDSEISRELAAGQASKEVLRRLSIPESVWQRSLQCHYQQVGQKLNGIPIVALKPARLLSLDEIRKVILRLTELTRAEISNIDTWTTEIEDPAMIALAMSVRPSDIVEEEMGIGEREINQALEKYMPQFGVEDQKMVQEYIKEIQTLPSKVMQKTGKTFSSY